MLAIFAKSSILDVRLGSEYTSGFIAPLVTMMIEKIHKYIWNFEFGKKLYCDQVYFYRFRSSHLEVFLEKVVLKICRKFTGEHPCRSAISIKLLCNFIEIALRHGCSPVNLLHIFTIAFPKHLWAAASVDWYITKI